MENQERKFTLEELPSITSELSNKIDQLIETINARLTLKNDDSQDLMTVGEVAKFMTVSKPTIYRRVGNGTLPFTKFGKRLYFNREDVLKIVTGQQPTALKD